MVLGRKVVKKQQRAGSERLQRQGVRLAAVESGDSGKSGDKATKRQSDRKGVKRRFDKRESSYGAFVWRKEEKTSGKQQVRAVFGGSRGTRHGDTATRRHSDTATQRHGDTATRRHSDEEKRREVRSREGRFGQATRTFVRLGDGRVVKRRFLACSRSVGQ